MSLTVTTYANYLWQKISPDNFLGQLNKKVIVAVASLLINI